MRIAQVLLSPRIGGAEALAEALAQHWGSAKVEVTTVYLDDLDLGPRGRLSRLLNLKSRLRNFRPDIVLAHSAIPNFYSRLAAPSRVPVITVLHSASDDFQRIDARLVERWLLRRTAHVVAVSEHQRAKYESYFSVKDKITVIPNGIRNDIFMRRHYRENPVHLVTVARVARQKNPKLWVEVVSEMDRLSAGFKLTWWGPVTDEPGISDMVNEFRCNLGIGSFAGPTTDPSEAYRSADAVFHPSDREAHSIGLLEAAASGLPVVCSRSVASTLPPQIQALIFEDDEAESAVQVLLRLRADWRKLAAKALDVAPKIQSEYSIASCADKYMSLFLTILQTQDEKVSFRSRMISLSRRAG